MAWIATVPYARAEGRLRRLYDRIKGPGDRIDEVMFAHGLRPHSLKGHIALRAGVLDHPRNTLPRSLLETIGIWVSLLNGCGHGVAHHRARLERLLGDDARVESVWRALAAGAPERAFAGRELALLRYAERLTTDPASLTEAHIRALRAAGLDDGEILEANQATAYVAYANRTMLGLGIIAEDGLGPPTSASDDPDDRGFR
jgi:uncharacterized peroxidase-related enzyme